MRHTDNEDDDGCAVKLTVLPSPRLIDGIVKP